MTDAELTDMFGGADLPRLLGALPHGKPPHVQADVLWALAAPDSDIPVADRRALFEHVCSCRECFSLLSQFRKTQFAEAEAPPSATAGFGTSVFERWNAVQAAFLVSLTAAGLQLRRRPFRMRMRDSLPVESVEVTLRIGDTYRVTLASASVDLRISSVSAPAQTFGFSLQIVPRTADLNPDEIRLQIRDARGKVVFDRQFTSGTAIVEDLPLSAYELLLTQVQDEQLIGLIAFQPTS
jgi:hypothetical protein